MSRLGTQNKNRAQTHKEWPFIGGGQVQQLTCNVDLSCSFYYLFFSFVLIELKPFVLKGKILKKCEKVRKSVKNSETICPLVVAL